MEERAEEGAEFEAEFEAEKICEVISQNRFAGADVSRSETRLFYKMIIEFCKSNLQAMKEDGVD